MLITCNENAKLYIKIKTDSFALYLDKLFQNILCGK